MSTQNISGTRRIWLALLPVLIYNVVLPYIIYRLASPHVPTTSALLLAAIPPAISTAIELLRRRRLNLLGTLVLVGIAIRILSALLLKDIRLILISDSLMIGVYGILALASLLIGKPLLQTLAINMLANTPSAEREQFEKRWREAGSSYFTFITALWGIGLTLVLVVSILLTYTLTVQQFVLIGPIIQYSIFGTLILLSQIIGILRRYKKHRLEQSQQQTQEKFTT